MTDIAYTQIVPAGGTGRDDEYIQEVGLTD